jgi:hypothetical protein
MSVTRLFTYQAGEESLHIPLDIGQHTFQNTNAYVHSTIVAVLNGHTLI